LGIAEVGRWSVTTWFSGSLAGSQRFDSFQFNQGVQFNFGQTKQMTVRSPGSLADGVADNFDGLHSACPVSVAAVQSAARLDQPE